MVSFYKDQFVHLHVHTGVGSILDGLCKVDKLVGRVKQLGQPSCAITDHGSMSGVYKFWKECTENEVKPLIGQEFYISNPDDDASGNKEKTGEVTNHHLILIAMNQQGYKNLCRLSSWGYMHGYYYKPRIDLPHLKQWNEGLICSTACIAGKVGETLCPKKGEGLDRTEQERINLAHQVIQTYKEIFGDRFYLEVMNHGLSEEQYVNNFIIQYSQAYDIPIVMTNDVHYVMEEQGQSHDYLLKINTGGKLSSADMSDNDVLAASGVKSEYNYYLKSQQEMAQLFSNYPDFTDMSYQVYERCGNVTPVLPEKAYPAFTPTNGYTTTYDQLSDKVWAELKNRGLDTNPEYAARLTHELEVIKAKDFADIFMLIDDICQYADSRGIFRGVRGSAAGSIIIWLLDVSPIDPIKEGLIFERFIDIERNEVPDIDTDWEPERRQEIIEYIRMKYGGSSHVVQIQAFGTLGPRQVLNDMARITMNEYGQTDYRYSLLNEMASRISTEAYVHDDDGVVASVSLEHCLKHDKGDPEIGKKSLQEIIAGDAYAQKMWQCALDMERLPRQSSTHAGGIIITSDEAFDIIPLQKATGSDLVITQFDMNDLEAVGVGKLDILGLNNLGVIAEAQNNIRKRPGYENFNIRKVPLDLDEIYEFISEGHTRGVFQMEAPSFTRCVVQIKPRVLQELADALALFRPGPLGDIDSDEISLKDEYCLRKHGKVGVIAGIGENNEYIRYVHPDMMKVLNNTQGTIIYQEQVMKIAHEVAGLGRTEGYKIIKAISKKKRELLAKWSDKFITSAVSRGYDQQWVCDLWDSIERFAGYSFNMAHAKSYAVVSYWTAYLSYHFPAEFFCAYLNSEEVRKKSEKRDIYIAECYNRDIQVLGPDINESGFSYTVTPSGIRYGLKSIKGIANSADYIVKNRELNGPYTSFDDFCNRLKPKEVNKTMKQILRDCGAFDTIDPSARAHMTIVDKIDTEIKLLGSTFDLSVVTELKKRYYSGVITPIALLPEVSGVQTVIGIISLLSLRKAHKSGNVFATGTIRDETGMVDFVCFTKIWESIQADCIKGSVWAFTGYLDNYNGIRQLRIINAEKRI